MEPGLILTFNAGSSSLKIGVFSESPSGAKSLARARIDLEQPQLHLLVHNEAPESRREIPLRSAISDDLTDVIDETMSRLSEILPAGRLLGVGHRVVHGGDRFSGPEQIDDSVLREIIGLTPLAPLHQPHCIRIIQAVQRVRPEVPQVASFDTVFHRSQSDLIRRFALPRDLHDCGIKRYGFHGLSYQFITERLAADWPTLSRARVVVAHLGSGASLCAIEGGLSRECSMGFSALDGLPMATRCGALDAGAVLFLLRDPQQTLDQVERMLYHDSGMLGVSGIDADTRVLLSSEEPQAREALDLFVLRTAQMIASQAVTLGGLDAVVFTAGIGEHQPEIRKAICERLVLFGVTLEAGANQVNAVRIDSAGSRVAVLVLATDEEQVIAGECFQVLRSAASALDEHAASKSPP